MTIMHQLGDPVAGAAECLCQHHGAAYAELNGTTTVEWPECNYNTFANAATIVQQAITITERCCIVVNAATITAGTVLAAALEIERPLASIRTAQEDIVADVEMNLLHHAAWEVLDPGTYTYFLVNRSGGAIKVYAAWLKIIASDCEG